MTESLYKAYYAAPDSDPSRTQLSSHWAAYSREFDVRLDEDGNVTAMEGKGFGDLGVRGVVRTGLSWICYASYWLRLPGKRRVIDLLPRALEVCRKMGAAFSFDCFKQVYTLALLGPHIERMQERRGSGLRVMVIGDGYGFLCALIKSVYPGTRLILVDIGKTLLFQAETCQNAYPTSSHALVGESDDAEILYCPAERLDEIEDWIDVAINIASMQEMTPETVSGYFFFLRTHCHPENLFYCCNREHKVLLGGEILKFHEYGWKEGDVHHIDELCPWYRYFFALGTARFRHRVAGVPVPFVHRFAGDMRHRLTTLATS